MNMFDFNRTERNQLQYQIEQLHQVQLEQAQQIKDLSMVIDQLEADKASMSAELDDLKPNNSLPWVSISGNSYDEHRGIKIDMDWNDEFIKYLESVDFGGTTDIVAVQRWLAMVNLHIIETLESQAIDADPRGTVLSVTQD